MRDGILDSSARRIAGNPSDHTRFHRHTKQSSEGHHSRTTSPSSSRSTRVHPSSTQKLNNFTRVPDYIAYLANILAALPQEEDQIRTIAGYLLKNNAHLILKASPEVAEYAKVAVLSAFNDPSALVRTAAGQDIVAFLGVLEPRNWPDCLEQLVAMLDDPNRQEVSLQRIDTCHSDVHAVSCQRIITWYNAPCALGAASFVRARPPPYLADLRDLYFGTMPLYTFAASFPSEAIAELPQFAFTLMTHRWNHILNFESRPPSVFSKKLAKISPENWTLRSTELALWTL